MDSKVKKSCPNCSQLFALTTTLAQKKSRLPLLLSCNHTVCESCIKNMLKFAEPIVCKVCKRNMEIPENNLALAKIDLHSVFPINFYLVGELACLQLETDTKMQSNKDCFLNLKEILLSIETKQGQCVECNAPTTKKCLQCALVQCESCFSKIHSYRSFKNHVLNDIETEVEPTYCKKHKGLLLQYYCKDCSKAICVNCMIVGGEKSCKDHNVLTLAEVNQAFFEELHDLAPNIDETFRRLTKTAVDIGNLLQTIETGSGDSALNTMKVNIHNHFARLHAEAQRHEISVMSIIDSIENTEKYSLTKAQKQIAESIKKSKQILNTISAISTPENIEKANIAAMLDEAKEVLKSQWYLTKDQQNQEPLKVTVNENLCALISDYVQLEGNASAAYTLQSSDEIAPEAAAALPPPPPLPVFPPETTRDVREVKKPNKPAADSTRHRETTAQSLFHAPLKYRSKGGSTSSINSCGSDSSSAYQKSHYGDNSNVPRPRVHQVPPPFLESNHPKELYEGCQEIIYISHIVDPHNLFVQRASHQPLVKEMLREFRNAVSYPKPSLGHISEGKTYLALNKADKEWQRARVMSVDRRDADKPRCRVFCHDFGSTEIVTIDNLRLLPAARLHSPPPLAIHCQVANCAPRQGAWTSEDSVLIQKIIDNKQAILNVRRIHKGNNLGIKVECDITTLEDGVSLVHALLFHERAKLLNPRLPYIPNPGLLQKLKLERDTEFKHKTVEEVLISHVISPDKFYVQKWHLRDTFNKMFEDMECTYSLSNPAGSIYCPEIGMVCAVNVEKVSEDPSGFTWRRGVVVECPGRMRVRVLLPDDGASVLVHWSALRQLHSRFTTYALQATECHLSGITPYNKRWNAGAVALLQAYVGKKLELHVEEACVSRGSVGVVLYDVPEDDTDTDKLCINAEMIKHRFAITIGMFSFNREYSTEEQVYTNKTPLDKPKNPRPRPKIVPEVSVLKRGESSKPTEIKTENLNAKDKGPLKLEVKVLSCQSPSLVYVSLVDQQKTYKELHERIQEHYSKNTVPSLNEWKVGERCCTVCKKSNTWRRAVIIEIKEEKAKILFSDFAFTEEVPKASLKELISEFAPEKIGDAAIKCYLSGVVPAVGEEWPSITKEYLQELVDAYQRIFITKNGEIRDRSLPVELWVYHIIPGSALEPNKAEWRCLNKKIIEQGLGVPDKSQKSQNNGDQAAAAAPGSGDGDDVISFFNVTGLVRDWLHLEPLPTEKLVVDTAMRTSSPAYSASLPEDSPVKSKQAPGSKLMAVSDWLPVEPMSAKEITAVPTYVDNDGGIYLHETSQQATLELIRRALDVRFDSSEAGAARWTVGQPCVARFYLDNKFYRGRVLDVNDDTAQCLIAYVDYGNEEWCAYENMRKTIVLHTIPIQAHRCVFARIRPVKPKWDRTTLDYIHKSIVEKECFVRVVGDKIGDVTPIDLKYDKLWINDHLVDFEMAVYTDGTQPVVAKFVEMDESGSGELNSTFHECDSGPDFIMEEDDEHRSTDTESFSMSAYENKDWVALMDKENRKVERRTTVTYPRINTNEEFLCEIFSLTELNFELNVIHNDETNLAYEEMYEEIQEAGENGVPLNEISANKACVALFHEDNRWYRAEILQYSEEKGLIKVKYTDYGNVEVLPLADVKEIREEWAKLPPGSITAQLNEIDFSPDLDVKVITEAYKKTFIDRRSEPLRATIVKYDGKMPLVELKDNEGNSLDENLFNAVVYIKTESATNGD